MKTDCGEGYRLLKNGEIILETDEYESYTGTTWIKMPIQRIGEVYDNVNLVPMRRKLESPDKEIPEIPLINLNAKWRLI